MNPVITYEMDYYIYEKELFLHFQELKTCKTETSKHSNQSSKRTLDNRMNH